MPFSNNKGKIMEKFKFIKCKVYLFFFFVPNKNSYDFLTTYFRLNWSKFHVKF